MVWPSAWTLRTPPPSVSLTAVLRELVPSACWLLHRRRLLSRGIIIPSYRWGDRGPTGRKSYPRLHRESGASNVILFEKCMPSTLLTAAWEGETLVTSILQGRKPRQPVVKYHSPEHRARKCGARTHSLPTPEVPSLS